MTLDDLNKRLAVCSWSLQPENPQQLLERLEATGIRQMQCALDPLRDDPKVWGAMPSMCADRGIQIVSGMFGTKGEDYSTLESIRLTGGLVPDATWDENWRNIQATAVLARQMGVQLVTFHAGFLPHEPAHPDFDKLLKRARQVADVFADNDLQLAMETGQETAETLSAFLQHLDRRNVGVNFDPANMILYNQGQPIDALRILSPWIRQCHIKDAVRTRTPGTWGEEVPVGTGQVDWLAFMRTLSKQSFTGHLVIEREAGTQRVQDIRTAVTHLRAVGAQGV
ncbi:MAG TPA: sugar phosphate isomerase/epimerase family protein [Candidatus Paceibacterota bacterium]|nr:sugar phosphate isomerase/epimerase family protein [Verrucomicrobiota bacterium]HRY47319.1 sugar phosphate isomerase/epimerase family protein [Candidatus Paceibacterota bacterium]HSA00260.1 sugar phosphate isomerase/epimerase family protein [Candidatus Paceibacterota bacterium]